MGRGVDRARCPVWEPTVRVGYFQSVTNSSRRKFLRDAVAAAATSRWATSVPAASGLAATSAALGARTAAAGDAHSIPIQVGDVMPAEAVLWASIAGAQLGATAAASVPARVRLFADDNQVLELRVEARADRGGTFQVPLRGLAPGMNYRAEVTLDGATAAPAGVATFRTPSTRPAPVRFVWSGDVCGQGFGIDPARGGLFAFDTMAERDPDFFIFSGDTVYADGPMRRSFTLPEGSTWTNELIPEKTKVAETLEEFRAQYRYNWLDPGYRRFFAAVPVVAQWDDHETRNNWYPTLSLDDDPRYGVPDCRVLSGRARRAFDEAFPRSPGPQGPIFRKVSRGPLLDVFVVDARSYRTTNDARGPGPHAFWGQRQAQWLARELAASRALWKVVACDMPLGLVVGDGPDAFEAVANGDPGPAGFREVEVQRVLEAARAADRTNLVFLTADVHYAAAHHYRHPFSFREYVAGPLHAGQFGPAALDGTFQPEVLYRNRDWGDPQNVAPSPDSVSYGCVEIEPERGVMTVSLEDGAGRTLFSETLVPSPRG